MGPRRASLLGLFTIILGSVNAQIDITEPCRYPVAVGMEKEYIPDRNIWATSQTNIARGPEYARLNGYKGGGAWTAGIPNNEQYLGIDLGYRHVINGVATQGRRGSYEFVTEYYLEFSSDNKTWSIYTNQYGTPLMFEGNENDDDIKRNNLEFPIIARYIRFNPQRWHQFISMRVEMYGCRFDGESATFDGASRITYDLSGTTEFVQTRNDYIKMRFRTNSPEGLLLFADSNQGDYIIVEMLMGRLYLHMDLGSTATASGDTSLKAGSLLDDNQWHDVVISREGREVNFTVDRLTITNMTNGDFLQLDLDRQVHLGGLDTFLHPGKSLHTSRNFTGCMENVWFNYMNMIKDLRLNQPRFNSYGAIMLGMCQVEAVVPFTFPNVDAHLKLPIPMGNRFRLAFNFRSHNTGGVLFYHDLAPTGRIMMKINDEGKLTYSVKTANDHEVTSQVYNFLSPTGMFTDGLWHAVYVDVEAGTEDRIGKINITVDGRQDTSERQLTFTMTETVFLGGGENLLSGEIGFLGCMKFIEVAAELVEVPKSDQNIGVVNGTCVIQDRCDPNPCEHGGVCTQDYNSFTCHCEGLGYEGAVCHRSKHQVSCEEARILNPLESQKDITVDIDDSGPLDPFPVTCEFMHDIEKSIMVVHHENEARTRVVGYQDPGSYVRPIIYPAQREQFDEIIERAETCEQSISWTCHSARLLEDAASGDIEVPSWGWWVSRTNLNMRYWGGTSPGSQMCSCALKNECRENKKCNCDAGLAELDISDSGLLTHKEHLPVMELRFGDTGTINQDAKWGEHKLGPLKCKGDSLFENTVTFRKADATIEFPTFDAATSGDIRFQFKTTAENGVFLQNTGRFHFIEIKLLFGNTLHFRFDIGNGIQTLEKITAYPLNDNHWHTILVERNRKQAMLKVDQQAQVSLDEPIDQGFRTLDLSSPLVIGAAVDYKDGFVGCMRALMANGKILNLKEKVERGDVTYGVETGCHGKCDSNPCLNNGICIEWYSHYQCDCAYTPFRGWVCGREVGVNMQPGHMIRYDFQKSSGTISTDEEYITIGFSTQVKRGILMQIIGGTPERPEYITVEMNNNGGVKVALDVGWEISRQEENNDIENKVDLANGQQHVVTAKRSNKGRFLQIFVDEYPVKNLSFPLDASADTKLDNPTYIYFGRNSTTPPGQGFEGCLFRAQFDNIYPFKRVFQDPRPDYVYLEPEGVIHEDMCGFEEVTHPPMEPEFRPTPTPDPAGTEPPFYGGLETLGDIEKILIGDPPKPGSYMENMCGLDEVTHPPDRPEYRDRNDVTTPIPRTKMIDLSNANSILIGVILVVVLLLLFGLAILLGRYFSQPKGAYRTHEAKDAQYYDNADYAVAEGHTRQPDVKAKKEWFI